MHNVKTIKDNVSYAYIPCTRIEILVKELRNTLDTYSEGMCLSTLVGVIELLKQNLIEESIEEARGKTS